MAKSKDQLLAMIDNLLVEINSQYGELKSSSQLEGIDIALLASNVDYLSSQVKALYHFQESVVKKEIVTKESELFTPAINLKFEADEQEIFEEIVEKPLIVDTVYESVKVDTAIENKVILEPILATEIEESVSVTELVEEPVVEVKEQIIASINTGINEEKVVSERPLTINELIQQQKKAGVNMTQQFQTATSQDKVSDLKGAISLNDKLMFIKDLFNGYSLAYSEALELLNRIDNYAEADAFLQTNYALKNGWAEKPQTVDKFYSLLRKKFNS